MAAKGREAAGRCTRFTGGAWVGWCIAALALRPAFGQATVEGEKLRLCNGEWMCACMFVRVFVCEGECVFKCKSVSSISSIFITLMKRYRNDHN